MQLVVSNNRVLAYGEDFLSMGGTVICNSTGKAYQNATIVECDCVPADIDTVGYEYHAGEFKPCAPYGKTDNGYIMVSCDECGTPKQTPVRVEDGAVSVAGGGTGATTAAAARENLGAAPTLHDSAETTYGLGTGTRYGHVKLNSSVSMSSGVDDGIAATPAAVKKVYDLAAAAKVGGDVESIATGGTGATTAAAARENLGITPANIGARTLSGGTTIPSNSDLDTYTTPGNYRAVTSATTNTLTNCPVTGTGFNLTVYTVATTERYVQEIVTNETHPDIFMRRYSGTAWGDWIQVITSDGGKMTGALTTNGIILTEGEDYGEEGTEPTNPVKGRLYITLL